MKSKLLLDIPSLKLESRVVDVPDTDERILVVDSIDRYLGLDQSATFVLGYMNGQNSLPDSYSGLMDMTRNDRVHPVDQDRIRNAVQRSSDINKVYFIDYSVSKE